MLKQYLALRKCSLACQLFFLNLVRRLFPKVLGLQTGRGGSSKIAVQETFQCQLNHCTREEKQPIHWIEWNKCVAVNILKYQKSHSFLARIPALGKDIHYYVGFLVSPHLQELKNSTRMTQVSCRHSEEFFALCRFGARGEIPALYFKSCLTTCIQFPFQQHQLTVIFVSAAL